MVAAPARADDGDQQAKALNDKAMGEFGLGDYRPAAEDYEAAFRLKPDAALLYNAAQAHRLAGNRKRALELYRNFVRLYGAKSPLAADARRRIADLEQKQDAGAEQPPAAVAPAVAPVAPVGPLPPAPEPRVQPRSPVAAAAPPSGETRPLALEAPAQTPPLGVAAAAAPPPPPPAAAPRSTILANPWLWVAVGAVVAGAVITIVALNPSYPDVSFGAAKGP